MVAFPNTTAQPLFVSITAEGTVEGTSAIQRAGNKYTFTSNLEQASIVIEASNIVLDGAGFTLQGEIYKINGNNVEIKNLKINSPATAIEIYGSNCKITNNEIQAEYGGIRIRNTNNHIISGNKIDAKVEAGIAFGTSSYNTVTENTIATSIMVGGVDLVSSDYNTFSRNTIHFISLYKSSYNILDENNLPQGILIRNKSNYNNITGNNIIDFNELTETNFMSSGSITLNGCEGNTISSNTISNSGGIFLDTSSKNVLKNNVITGTGKGFEVSGSPQPSLSSFINDIDDSNTINGKKIYYLIDKSDLSINPSTYPNIGYLALVNCKRMTVENIHLNTQGILLAWTTDSQIKNSDISNNYGDGVILNSASNNKITNNNLTSNSGAGIILRSANQNLISGNHITRNQQGISFGYSSSNNTITQNNIADQGTGVYFHVSSSNLIYNNNFVNNTRQVHDVSWGAPDQNFPGVPSPSENIWDNGYPLGGNYWSDYSGMETYVIDENNVDHYPQTQQINFSALAPTPTPTVPELSSLAILSLFLSMLFVAVILRHRKPISQNKPTFREKSIN
jgi:parallel beta-helix repeat protein